MQITISGDIGSGKSTVGEFLANKLNMELIDCGQLYRAYASKRDMSVLELNKSGDNSIDKLIDADITRMGREDIPRVYISRTAWHFIPNAIHVYMIVNPKLAAERIFKRKAIAEKHNTVESILKYNEERIAEEDARYEKMYGITRKQQIAESNIIMCIGNASIDEVCYAMLKIISKERVLCFDPRVAAPTQVLHDTSVETVNDYARLYSSNILDVNTSMQIVNGIPYIVDGHHRIAAACIKNAKFVYTDDFQIVDSPICKLSNSDYYDWEDFVKGDMSQVIDSSKVVTDFSSAVSKMSGE